MGVANRIGTSILPFHNPRVVCPPGVTGVHGRPNIVVATPMRSGTHVMIDLLLNNLPAYRTRPLYVDLDQCVLQSTPHDGPGDDLVRAVASDAGYVVKTHLPTGPASQAEPHPEVPRILDAAVVVTVRRDWAAVERSLARWGRTPEELERHHEEFDAFWDFWSGREHVALAFDDLFDPARVRTALSAVADRAGVPRRARQVMPPRPGQARRIYARKAATRLVGHRVVRVDTTIHTLKG